MAVAEERTMGLWCSLRDAFRGASSTEGRVRDVHERIRAVVFTIQPLMPDDAALGAQWRERIDMLIEEDMDSLLREGEEALWLEILCSNLDEYDIPLPPKHARS
jgi:hypothetical protein